MNNGRRRPKLSRVRKTIADRKRRRGLLRHDLPAVQQAGEVMIPSSLIEVVIREDAPAGESGSNWRRADITVGGEIESTGFARGQASKLTPEAARLVESEAITLAWHYFRPKVRITRGVND